MILTLDTSSEDYDRRMQAARNRSTWELGSPGYAGVILGAFLYPDEDTDALEAEANS